MTDAVPDNGSVTTTAPAPAPESGKKKRGRETAGDMIRSLGIVLLIVVALWFFAQPPDTDEAEVRVVDPSSQVQAWRAAVPGAPVAGDLPEGWRPTAAYYDRDPDRLRVAHVTPQEQYAEFAATQGISPEGLEELTGAAEPTETVDVDGEPWDLYQEDDGSRSLVREFGDVTVVVGSLRATASLDELTVLARSVAASR